MEKFVLVLACVAYGVYGRRAQFSTGSSKTRHFDEHRKPSKAVHSVSNSLADILQSRRVTHSRAKNFANLLSMNPAAAFNLPGARAPHSLQHSGLQAATGRNRLGHPNAIATLRRELPEDATKQSKEQPKTLWDLNGFGEKIGELSMSNYAKAHANSQQDRSSDPETEKYYREVLDLRRRVLGEKHPDTIRAASMLNSVGHRADTKTVEQTGDHGQGTFSAFQKMQRESQDREVEEDISLMKSVFDRQHRVLGLDHPDTIMSLYNYAKTMGDLGRQAKAEPLKKQALDLSRLVLGPQHPKTVKILSGYAETLDALGRQAEAEPLKMQVLETRRRTLGPEHPDTLGALSSYAETLHGLGREAEALKTKKEVLDLTRRQLGPKHEESLEALNSYATMLEELGDVRNALPLRKELFELTSEALGEEDQDSIEAMNKYADTLSELGQHAEAEPLLDKARELTHRAFSEESHMRGFEDLFGTDFHAEPLMQF